ncbi:hypothetical protein [Nocardia cyriacigeorgica]|uniref:hypothetical protein n=1 Tax=Nocardia cyriacigeorgica TaxID=135487 RepID=UPI0018961477|nr:hypothetical protein [Nocardia cyriacigeorgica]MBF6090646.1 hypothetical protein [Nocardia cyriacigeorgica]MBF6095874.1 hypothetical protein [Nocardia cyriacigeorgica]
MTTPNGAELLSHWKTLKTQAENGELRLNTEVGEALKRHADELLLKLNSMLGRTQDLAFVSGFGTLGSAVELQKKFAAKAVSDEDSAANRLKESIDIVTLMRDTYALSISRLQETDQSTAGALGQAGAQ